MKNVVALDALFADLNPEQRAAAQHGRDPLLIVAGAGTGKTTTLAHRVAGLIAGGVDPRRILLLTFTRRASAEMLRRVDGLLARWQKIGDGLRPAATRELWGGTFHAVATRLLRQYGRLIGLPPDFTIMDRSDAEDLMNILRSELGLAKTKERFPLKETCQDIYSRVVNTQKSLDHIVPEEFPWVADHTDALKQLFNAYTDRKEQQQTLDYDDLLLFWHVLMTMRECAEVIRRQFDCVLVDEYQDTNTLQFEILRGLSPDGQGITVVGDDAQAIYSFRAATVQNILVFPQQFPNVTIVRLEQNYRSTQPLLDATNAVIALAKEGHRKTLWSSRKTGEKPAYVPCLDETEQTDSVIERILHLRETGIELRRQAVLFRASHHSLALELELSRRNIPFHKFGGIKFVEAAHVKDLLAFLRLAENPRDAVSALRILLLLPGIGPKKASQLWQMLHSAEGAFDCWNQFTPPAATAAHWPLFLSLLTLLHRSGPKQLSLAEEVQHVRRFYRPLLEQKYENAAARYSDLEHLEQISSRFANRSQMLAELTLDPPGFTQDSAADSLLDDDWLTLSTIHSSKGLEWDAVYVLHATDGNIPSSLATNNEADIEEERRLFYVALTRAKTWLTICHPQRSYFSSRSHIDQHRLAQRTRFLPDSILHLFETLPARQESSPSEAESHPAFLSTAAVRQRIGKLW